MNEPFSEKVVYITGGSSGIGLAVAESMAVRGAHVLMFARRIGALEEAVERVKQSRKNEHQKIGCYPLDVADPNAVKRVMDQAVMAFGIPDILINSAGRARPEYFEKITVAHFNETLGVNLGGVWNTIAVLLPYMRERGAGHIVNVASIAGFLGLFGYTDYCASKFGVIGLSEALRNELKPHGIHVSVLCPPDTDTPGYAMENVGKPPETRAISKNAKLMSAADVARDMMNGMIKKRFMIIPSMDGRLLYFAKRWLPGVVEKIMDHTVKKVRRKPSDGDREFS